MKRRTVVSPEVKSRVEIGEVAVTQDFHQDPKDPVDPKHVAKVEKVRVRYEAELKHEFPTLAERVAQSKYFELNYRIPEAEKHFPDEIKPRFVTKYFQFAKGGPLWVDEPTSEAEMLHAYTKQKILRKLGLRSLVIEIGAEHKDLHTSFYDCLEQLGEI